MYHATPLTKSQNTHAHTDTHILVHTRTLPPKHTHHIQVLSFPHRMERQKVPRSPTFERHNCGGKDPSQSNTPLLLSDNCNSIPFLSVPSLSDHPDAPTCSSSPPKKATLPDVIPSYSSPFFAPAHASSSSSSCLNNPPLALSDACTQDAKDSESSHSSCFASPVASFNSSPQASRPNSFRLHPPPFSGTYVLPHPPKMLCGSYSQRNKRKYDCMAPSQKSIWLESSICLPGFTIRTRVLWCMHICFAERTKGLC